MYCIARHGNGFEPVGVMGHVNEKSESQARIVRYWRAVEYFSPPKVDPVDPRKGVRAVHHGRRLPWGKPEVLESPGDKQVWRHTVYAGIFDIGKVREVLQNALRAPDAEHDLDGRIGGKSALLSFAVDDTGHLLKESITLSSCAWAVSRTLMRGPESDAWLDGFAEDQERLLSYLFEIGDGRIRIDTDPGTGPRGGRWPGLIAGTAARVALDVATGGITALPSVVSVIATPAVGPIGAKVIEQVGNSLAKDAADAISTAFKARKDDEHRASGADGGRSGSDEDSEAPASAPSALGTKILTVDDLAAITRWVAEILGVAEALTPDAIRVKSYKVPLRSADDASADEFLNSFYADDLERVADAVEAGDAGAALTAYLRAEESIDMTRRIDLRESPRTILQALAPESMPLGRWPGKPDQPLALSQQFAINKIFHGFKERDARGVYAVNGPPGTGKTTMLRDLIAALVAERATHLAKLPSARDAFGKKPLKWRTEDNPKRYQRTIHPLKPELTGFEIVVASSNNGAVENVTLEVPAAKAVHLKSFPDADYLSDPATILTGTPCWGAIAARLGRRTYRQDFVNRF
jgi:hypothetical protein